MNARRGWHATVILTIIIYWSLQIDCIEDDGDGNPRLPFAKHEFVARLSGGLLSSADDAVSDFDFDTDKDVALIGTWTRYYQTENKRPDAALQHSATMYACRGMLRTYSIDCVDITLPASDFVARGYPVVRRLRDFWIVVGASGLPSSNDGQIAVFVLVAERRGAWTRVASPENNYFIDTVSDAIVYRGEFCLAGSRHGAAVLVCKNMDSLLKGSKWHTRFYSDRDKSVASLATFSKFAGHDDDSLFIGTETAGGYRVLCSHGDIYRWDVIVDSGFGEGASRAATAMAHWNGHLYVGTSPALPTIKTKTTRTRSDDGRDEEVTVIKGAELIRIDAAGSVRLIMGDVTPVVPTVAVPDTRDAPTSGLSSGFGDPERNARISRIANTTRLDGSSKLFAGTFDASHLSGFGLWTSTDENEGLVGWQSMAPMFFDKKRGHVDVTAMKKASREEDGKLYVGIGSIVGDGFSVYEIKI